MLYYELYASSSESLSLNILFCCSKNVKLRSQKIEVKWKQVLPFFSPRFIEHPIHAPPTKGDPFAVEMLDTVGCALKMKKGVVHVFKDQEHMEKDEPLDFPYCDVDSFLADQNLMYCFIMDGPL